MSWLVDVAEREDSCTCVLDITCKNCRLWAQKYNVRIAHKKNAEQVKVGIQKAQEQIDSSLALGKKRLVQNHKNKLKHLTARLEKLQL